MAIRRDSVLSILRLSDIHIWGSASADDARQETILRHLLTDLAKLKHEFAAPDLVLITGDIVQSGTSAAYEDALRLWIKPICDTLHITRNRIFVVPGNHDVNHDEALSADRDLKLHEQYREDPPKAMDTLIGGKTRRSAVPWEAELIFRKFKAYIEFCSEEFVHCQPAASKPYFIVENWTPKTNSTYDVDPVQICGLNSAFLSIKGDFDKKKWGNFDTPLALGGQQINAVVEGDSGKLRLVLIHHPPELLADGEELKSELNAVPHLLFVGHMHDQSAEITDVVTQDGHIVFRAAATYLPTREQGGERRHGYDFIRVTRDGIEYFPRIHKRKLTTFCSGVEGEPTNSEDAGEEIGRRIIIRRNKLPQRFLTWLDKQLEQPAKPAIIAITRSQTNVMAAIPATIPPPRNLPRNQDKIDDSAPDTTEKINPFANRFTRFGIGIALAASALLATSVYIQRYGLAPNSLHQEPSAHVIATPEFVSPVFSAKPTKTEETTDLNPVGILEGIDGATTIAVDREPNGNIYVGIANSDEVSGQIVRVSKQETSARKTIFEGHARAMTATMTTLGWVDRKGFEARVHTFDLIKQSQKPTEVLIGYHDNALDKGMYPFGIALTNDGDPVVQLQLPIRSRKGTTNKYVLTVPKGEQYPIGQAQVAAMNDMTSCGIAVGANAAFFGALALSKVNGTIYHAPFSGRLSVLSGTQTDNYNNPHGMAFYDDKLVVVDDGQADDNGTLTIYRLVRDSITGVLLADKFVPRQTGLHKPHCVAADDKGISWTNFGNGSIGFRSWDPTPRVHTITVMDTHPQTIALDTDHVYWTSSDGKVRITKRP